MRKVITRTTEIACTQCAGSGAFHLYDDAGQPTGTVACPKCLGQGTLPSYFNEEVDDGEDEPETDRGVHTLNFS